jgi:two-component system, probable response regulator PhcQ
MRPTILLVDDEPNVRKALMRVFAEGGYRIFTTSNSDQALRILQEHRIDVIISDERMPGITGVQLLKIVREFAPETIRIILTGEASLESAIAAINEGEIFRFLVKPWNDEELLETVCLGIARRQHRGETVAGSQELERQQLLESLNRKYPGITEIHRGEDGAILL